MSPHEVHQGEHDATNAYQSLSETTEHDDPRWAFGTGFEDVEAEISAPVPEGTDPADLAAYCQMLGDDALIYSQRLSEWVANAPELEEEVALANTALDLLGQARVLLSRAGHVEGRGRGEDAFAYLRDQAGFRNIALAEQSDDLDFARCIARLLIFSTWRLALLHRLLGSADPVIAAVAGKGVKELTYHRDYAARWALRLGDGTEESHRRMQAGLEWAWPYVEELFRTSDEERRLVEAGVAVDPAGTREEFDAVLAQVLEQATLARPEVAPVGTIGGRSGRQGIHTERLGHVLAEMQSVAREHPGATW
ncbi:phenylacetate-CoA oxygenase subunit PaaC [Pseudonocardia sp. RS11V-5]|uniref:1,2-phenylacetyl-CoA epoxidase subunit PaaC n=1 Tax=Pseudonocardia terrae TaxID=2905831 RepID=UPI001E5CAA10|nr:1,2-phenylacetyl-CoA epoxidase subunit PaaC [Pseudonocardia terrae]MCE3550684.1 phenylacetate-CoA oxygenase subunit PaaC [Pseudonocardia terrae]